MYYRKKKSLKTLFLLEVKSFRMTSIKTIHHPYGIWDGIYGIFSRNCKTVGEEGGRQESTGLNPVFKLREKNWLPADTLLHFAQKPV